MAPERRSDSARGGVRGAWVLTGAVNHCAQQRLVRSDVDGIALAERGPRLGSVLAARTRAPQRRAAAIEPPRFHVPARPRDGRRAAAAPIVEGNVRVPHGRDLRHRLALVRCRRVDPHERACARAARRRRPSAAHRRLGLISTRGCA